MDIRYYYPAESIYTWKFLKCFTRNQPGYMECSMQQFCIYSASLIGCGKCGVPEDETLLIFPTSSLLIYYHMAMHPHD